MSTQRLRLGQLLVDAKMLSEQALAGVLAAQERDGRRLGTLLVEHRLVNETQLTQILSHQLSVPWVSLLHIEFSRRLLNLVPHDVAERYCLVPIYVRNVRNQGETLYVAMDDPTHEDGLRACAEHSGLPVRAMIAPPVDIRNAIRVYYGASGPTIREVVHSTEAITTPPPALRSAAIPPPPPSVREIAAFAAEPSPAVRVPRSDAPTIEAVEIVMDDAYRESLQPPEAEPPSERKVASIPAPKGVAPRMVSLTLLDGTTISLPAKRRPRSERAPSAVDLARGTGTTDEDSLYPDPRAAPTLKPPSSRRSPAAVDPAMAALPSDEIAALTALDLVTALRAVANGADASEVLGSNVRWESVFAALLALVIKKGLIADWEFVEELKKRI